MFVKLDLQTLDYVIKNCTPSEVVVFLYIYRKTIGYQKSEEWISTSLFMKETNLTKNTILKTRATLKKKGLINFYKQDKKIFYSIKNISDIPYQIPTENILNTVQKMNYNGSNFKPYMVQKMNLDGSNFEPCQIIDTKEINTNSSNFEPHIVQKMNLDGSNFEPNTVQKMNFDGSNFEPIIDKHKIDKHKIENNIFIPPKGGMSSTLITKSYEGDITQETELINKAKADSKTSLSLTTESYEEDITQETEPISKARANSQASLALVINNPAGGVVQGAEPVSEAKAKNKSKEKKYPDWYRDAWKFWCAIYREKYKAPYLQNGKNVKIFYNILEQIGEPELAREVLQGYLLLKDSWYVRNFHKLEYLLSDLQKILVMVKNKMLVVNKRSIQEAEKTAEGEQSFYEIKKMTKAYEIIKKKTGKDPGIVGFTMDVQLGRINVDKILEEEELQNKNIKGGQDDWDF